MVSRIGKVPLEVPEKVTVSIEGNTITLKSDKGEFSQVISPELSIAQEGNQLVITSKNDESSTQSVFGLTRTLLSNYIKGLTEGFSKQLEIIGTGYNVELKGNDLAFRLGYSHPISFPQPDGIKFDVKDNVITVSGIDKQQVGEIAANIRKLRPPEPYKGKGVKYVDEHIRRKAGKAGKA